jgi:hypothetical protein
LPSVDRSGAWRRDFGPKDAAILNRIVLPALRARDEEVGQLKGLAALQCGLRGIRRKAMMLFRDGPAAIFDEGVDSLLIDQIEASCSRNPSRFATTLDGRAAPPTTNHSPPTNHTMTNVA